MQYRLYSASQRKLMWERWKQGDTLHDFVHLSKVSTIENLLERLRRITMTLPLSNHLEGK